jgi:uncharacterized Tic20 family protein
LFFIVSIEPIKKEKKKTIERIIYEKNSSVVFFLLLLLLLIGVVFRLSITNYTFLNYVEAIITLFNSKFMLNKRLNHKVFSLMCHIKFNNNNK